MDEPLRPEEVRLWRAFLRWSEGTLSRIASDLAAGSSLSVSDFEVGVRLNEETAGMSQGDLCESLEWTPSRLSHQLRRMEQRGLVSKVPLGKGRAVRVSLTDDGRRELKQAMSVHAESVRSNFLSTLEDELSRMREKYDVD